MDVRNAEIDRRFDLGDEPRCGGGGAGHDGRDRPRGAPGVHGRIVTRSRFAWSIRVRGRIGDFIALGATPAAAAAAESGGTPPTTRSVSAASATVSDCARR